MLLLSRIKHVGIPRGQSDVRMTATKVRCSISLGRAAAEREKARSFPGSRFAIL
jgi:hypothetical protein